MLKKLFITIGVLAVVVVVSVYMLTSNINSIVKTAIEEGGSRVTGVQVRLDKSNIDLANARGALFGLSVANPAGFNTARAIKFGAIGLELGSGSTTRLLVIDKVVIDGPEITYEIGITGSNIDAIQDHIDEYTSLPSLPGEKIASLPLPGVSDDISSSNDSIGPKLWIKDLYINNAKLNVSASLMQGKTLSTTLPDIHLEDIGEQGGGAGVGEVADEIMAAISKHAGSAAGSLDLGQLGLSDWGKNLEGVTKGATDTLEKAGSGATDALGSGLKDAGDTLKGIFK